MVFNKKIIQKTLYKIAESYCSNYKFQSTYLDLYASVYTLRIGFDLENKTMSELTKDQKVYMCLFAIELLNDDEFVFEIIEKLKEY